MMREARELWCGIRPEDLSVVPPDTGRAGLLRGDVIAVEPLGPDTLVTVSAAGQDILLRVPAKTIRAAGEAVTLAIDPDKLHLFDRQSGIRLCMRQGDDMNRITRRAAIAGAGLATLARPAIAQATKQVSILTWNIPDAKPLMDQWIKDFTATRPGVEVQWLDKKGPDLPAFYQTQLVAGTPPDVIDLQGGLGIEYAAQGALTDLTPMLTQHTDVKARFNPDYLANWVYDGKSYMLPFYVSKTLLFYNKTLFGKAGLAGPPQSFDEILTQAGEDRYRRQQRLHHAQFRLAVLAAVQNEQHRAADARPEAPGVRHAGGDRCHSASGQGHRRSGDRQDIVDRALGGAARRFFIRAHRHAARPFAGLSVHQGPGSVGERNDARRGADAGQLGGAEQPRPGHLETIAQSRAGLGTAEFPDRSRRRRLLSPATSRC